MDILLILIIIVGIVIFIKWFIYDRNFYFSLRKEDNSNNSTGHYKKTYTWNENTHNFDDKEDLSKM